jgi:hypothetical protein
MGFLYEGTQIRAALAISIALHGVILFSKKKYIKSCFITILSSMFHVSMIFYISAFMIYYLLSSIKSKLIFISALIFFLTLINAYNPNLLYIIEIINPRFLEYFDQSALDKANKSGLFQYYFIFITYILSIIVLFDKPNKTIWEDMHKIVVFFSILSIILLNTIGLFSVPVATRISELLLLPALLVIGNLLTRKDLGVIIKAPIILSLLIYSIARGYVTYFSSPIMS